MEGQYNLRSPAVKRLMKEAQELREPTEQFYAQPLEDNLFEWHFTIRGPADSEFDGGIYHGRIILPPEYPMKPPSIILLTPNGRFETHKKICLSISGYHPESWQPSWSLRTALLAIIGFMPTHGNGAIGSLDYSTDERKVLARKSVDWKCDQCGHVNKLLHPVTEASQALNKEAKELGSQIKLQGEKEKPSASDASSPPNESSSTTATASSSNPIFSSAGVLPPHFAPFIGSLPQFPVGSSASQALSGVPMFPHPQFPPFMFPPVRMPPFMPPFIPPPGGVPASWPAGPFSVAQPGFPWPPFPAQRVDVGNPPATASLLAPVTSSAQQIQSAPVTSSAQQTQDSSSPATQQLSSSTTGTSASASPEGRPSSSPAVPSTNTTTSRPHGASSDQSHSPTSDSSNVQSPAVADDDPVLSVNELRRRRAATEGRQVVADGQSTAAAGARPHQTGGHSASWLVNIVVAMLVICIAILLARRLYLMGTRW